MKALLKKIGLKGMKSTVGNGKPALEHSYKMESLRSDTLIFVLHLLGAFIVKANQAAALSNAIIQGELEFRGKGGGCGCGATRCSSIFVYLVTIRLAHTRHSRSLPTAKFVFASNGLRCFSVPPRPS